MSYIAIAFHDIDKSDGVDSRHEMAPLMKCTTLRMLATYLLVTTSSNTSVLSAVIKVCTQPVIHLTLYLHVATPDVMSSSSFLACNS